MSTPLSEMTEKELKRERLAVELKRRLGIWTESSEKILEVTEGTLLRASAEMYLALCDLRDVVICELQKGMLMIGDPILRMLRKLRR